MNVKQDNRKCHLQFHYNGYSYLVGLKPGLKLSFKQSFRPKLISTLVYNHQI